MSGLMDDAAYPAMINDLDSRASEVFAELGANLAALKARRRLDLRQQPLARFSDWVRQFVLAWLRQDLGDDVSNAIKSCKPRGVIREPFNDRSGEDEAHGLGSQDVGLKRVHNLSSCVGRETPQEPESPSPGRVEGDDCATRPTPDGQP